jgi:hypothetical protein
MKFAFNPPPHPFKEKPITFKKFAQAALAVFAFGFVVHGVLLKGMYVETEYL